MGINPKKLYEILTSEFGNLNWWPIDKSYHEKNGSDPRFEIMVGAILTQNTAWSNVEKALSNLKSLNILDLEKITNLKIDQLTKHIRPSGFFNQKAKRLKDFAEYIKSNYNGDLNNFFDREPLKIRQELLELNGIGFETADSILLYAGNFPIFVVDAYTKRLCQRLPLKTNITYNEIQQYFESELSKTFEKKQLPKVYNQLHALIVIFAKDYCKKKPDCIKCPIKVYCRFKK